MSVNFNIALLRSVKAPLMDSLKKLYDQIQELVDGKREVKAFEGISEAHLVVGSLTMIDAQGASFVAQTLETLVAGLQTPNDARFQNLQDLHQGLRAAQQGIKALDSYLTSLVDGASDRPILLWAPWAGMMAVLGREATPSALFFPVPSFDDETFRPIDPSDLKMTVESLRRRFDEGSNQWAATDSALNAETSLRQIQGVLNELYNLHHRKGYQSYWLALLARVESALHHPQQERDDKRPLGALLDQASVELRKFAEDQKRVTDDVLRAVVRPLVTQETLDLSVKSPILAKFVHRFEVRAFLQAAEEQMNSEGVSKLDAFVQRHQEFKETVNQVKVEWAKLIGTSLEKRNLLKSLTLLLQKREGFPGPAADHLLASLAQVSAHYQTNLNLAITEDVGAEVAIVLVMLDAFIDKRGAMGDDFTTQCDLQKRRVSLVLAQKLDALSALPKATWDQQTQQEQGRQAMQQVVQEVQKDVGHIEHLLDDILQDREDSRVRWPEVDNYVKIATGALRIMGQQQAARVLDGVRQVAQNFGQKSHVISDMERAQVTVGIGALSTFLNAFEGGDLQASRFLDAGLKTLFNESAVDEEGFERAPRAPMVLPDDSSVPVESTPVVPHDESLPSEETAASVLLAPPVSHQETEVPPAKPAVPDVGLAGWDESLDHDIAEPFLEEAVEALQEVRLQMSTLQHNPSDREALVTVRRQFHTLKGSGRMAQFHRLGSVSWSVEEQLNEVLEGSATMTPSLRAVIEHASVLIAEWVETLLADQSRSDRDASEALRVWIDGASLVPLLDAHRAASAPVPSLDEIDEALEALPPLEEAIEPVEPTSSPNQDDRPFSPEPSFVEPPLPALAEVEHEEPSISEPTRADAQDSSSAPALGDAPDAWTHEMFEHFKETARENADLLSGEIAVWYMEEQGPWMVSETFVTATHNLRVLGQEVGLKPLIDLASVLEIRARKAWTGHESLGADEALDLFEDTALALKDMIAAVVKQRAHPEERLDLIERLQASLKPSSIASMEPSVHEVHHAPPVPPIEQPQAPTPTFEVGEDPEAAIPLSEDPDPSYHEPSPTHEHLDSSVSEEERLPIEATANHEHDVDDILAAFDDHDPSVKPVAPLAAAPSSINLEKKPESPIVASSHPAEDAPEVAQTPDPWDDALDALSVMAVQLQRLTIAFEALAQPQR